MQSTDHSFSYQVSIIIINYNTLTLLKECLLSIYEKTNNLAYEIIVIDNASKENPENLLTTSFPDVTFIRSSSNLGFGKANNSGAQYAQGEYLFFLNSDTLLVNNAISLLYHFIKDRPNIGICGANLYDSSLRPNLSYFGFPSVEKELRDIFTSPKINMKKHFNYSGKPQKVDCVSGAALMIRKNIFTQVGAFDPDFFLYYEETELIWRVTQAGFQVFSVPEAKIIHYHGMSSKQTVQSFNSNYLFSKFLYFKKTHPQYTPYLIKQFELAKCIIALIYFFIKSQKDKLTYWKTKYHAIKQLYIDFQHTSHQKTGSTGYIKT